MGWKTANVHAAFHQSRTAEAIRWSMIEGSAVENGVTPGGIHRQWRDGNPWQQFGNI